MHLSMYLSLNGLHSFQKRPKQPHYRDIKMSAGFQDAGD